MKKSWLVPLALVAGLALGSSSMAFFAREAKPMLAHIVFFTLKDHSKESVEKFTDACHKYLTDHKGAIHFAVGTRATDVEEPPSVKDFDVALHIVFDGKESLETYIKSDRHQSFLTEARPMMEKARVFDSYLIEP